ncbi:MAG: hypothetical protein KAS62_02965, partial [Candidatus Delongbacteria bacterium]|nr:hypothetical protein [Candidatus Delongbacteria bacterium]
RYEFISNSTYRDIYTNLPADKLYLDLLEEGYDSERLWETIFSDGKMIGYILPVFSNGLKNSIEMIDYGLTYSNDIFQMIAINRLVEIAKDNDVDDLTINVNDSDTKFVDLANELKLVENHTTVKFIKA